MSYFLVLSKCHGDSVLSQYQRLRDDQRMCDIVLETRGVQFPAHRSLLACASDYFWALLKDHTRESRDTLQGPLTLSLPALTPTGLERLLDFVYSSWLCLSPSTLEETLEAARYLQVSGAVDLCARYIADNLAPESCCFFANVAARYGLSGALKAAEAYIARHMRELLGGGDGDGERAGLMELNLGSLRECLGAEDVPGVRESELLGLALDWLDRNRLPALQSNLLLSHVRFGLVAPRELTRLTAERPALRTPFIGGLVDKALQYHAQGPLQPLLQSAHTRIRAAAGGDGHTLLVGGGPEADRPQRLVQSFDPETRKFRTLATQLPGRLQHHCVCVLGGFLFVLGGEEVETDGESEKTAVMTVSGRAWRYDPRFRRWDEAEPMIQRRARFACCVLDGVIYAVGGRAEPGEPPLSTAERYNLRAGCWRKSAGLPHAVHGQACAVLGRRVYISGGIHGEAVESSKDVLCLDVSEGRAWEKRAAMSVARFGHQMAAVGGRIYAFLGMYEQFCDIERYDPELDQWTRLRPLLNDRFCYGLSATPDGRVLLFGGRKWHDGQEVVMSNVMEYDTESDTWRELCRMPGPLCGTQCVQLPILDTPET
ncbi:kelch-like protein 34 [Sardina pilchardus]|uniref:kelch-like protein 34 n=1 Tax=Sardina pilchardus TaxID=27697 RepID=UPI002E117A23